MSNIQVFLFRPWQAVNIAKNVGNVAKFLGPLLSVGLLAVDVYAVAQEEELDKKLADARREITSQFIKMAKDLESQVEAQLREVEAQVYGEIEKQIGEVRQRCRRVSCSRRLRSRWARQKEEVAIATSNQWVGELAAIRKEFEEILRKINDSGNKSSPIA